MKNYVIWTNCKITETLPQHGIEAAGTPGVQESYQKMFDISVASARHNLRGEWEGIEFGGTFASRVEMFKANWERIYALWHQEPCNILYLDSDTIIIKPIEIFGRFSEYRLFNWTTPPKHEQFEHYFNAAVRYYPASMSAETWEIGDTIAQNWDLDIWDQEQVIFNRMFWSQGLRWEDIHHPELNWQAESGLTIPELAAHVQFNTLPISHARVIHYHGTRSHSRGTFLATMLAQAAGIPV
jgi:hypothetical protein